MQEDNAADVVQSNGIKGNIVCIHVYWNNFYEGVNFSQNIRLSFVHFFKHFKMAVFNL